MKIGKVILAGAGPGDIDLVTIKLVNQLRLAEVILIDRLVNPEIIKKYASPQALVINVGKQGYESTSTSQENINQLLVQHALNGKNVIRLKGGDVAIYSNVLEEIIAITEHEIPFEIIPGITAASGAAASLSIPLTGRHIATGVQIHSLAVNQEITTEEYEFWAKTEDTLVFYMTIAPLKKLLENLLRMGINKTKAIAVIEQATTPSQKNHITTILNLLHTIDNKTFSSPSLVIIGDILSLAKQTIAQQDQSVFNPLNSLSTKI